MAVPALHRFNAMWLIGDPEEMNTLGPTIGSIALKALSAVVDADRDRAAVVIGAYTPSAAAGVLFDTETVFPTADSIELRPLYQSIFQVCDAIAPHIANGLPASPDEDRILYNITRNRLIELGVDSRSARVLCESAIAVVHFRAMPADMIVTLHPDGRLLVMKTELLSKLVISYLEDWNTRMGAESD